MTNRTVSTRERLDEMGSVHLTIVPTPNSLTGGCATIRCIEWGRVVELNLDGGGLVLHLGPLVVAVLALAVAIAFVPSIRRLLKAASRFDVVEAELQLANLGRIKIKPNLENIQIAHEAWVELTTRKAALPFEEDHDVIVEVYDSYYQLFSRLRDLTKSIPAHKLRQCSDTRKLVLVMVAVLNHALRPHLTRWQARFRRWYDNALKEDSNRGKSPQEIQRGFPEYSLLVSDLKALQINVVKYSEFLREIAHGKGA